MTRRPRVLLLVPARSYRAAGFMQAAARMNLDVTVASDGALPLGGGPVIPARDAGQVVSQSGPVDAVVATDAPMLQLAAAVAARLGRPHNPADALLAASGKARQRQRWARPDGVAQPRFLIVPDRGDVRAAAVAIGFPCVVKAVSLSASQGVLRAGDPDQAVRAAARIRRILIGAGNPAGPLLIEAYLPGPELSIDGLLANGAFTPLVIFDKPAMGEGPTFEETLLTTPSRLPPAILAAAADTAGRAARALGLRTGPIHAELRITSTGPALLELAARSIGGLCSRALSFPTGSSTGASLEELILANALGVAAPAHQAPSPGGVFMLPVPQAGVLRAVEGRADAEAVPGITGVTICVPPGRQVRPLPDGDQYLGFIFAQTATPAEAETALTAASRRLRVVIENPDSS